MNLEKIYIGEKDPTLKEVFKHLISEIYKGSIVTHSGNLFIDIVKEEEISKKPNEHTSKL